MVLSNIDNLKPDVFDPLIGTLQDLNFRVRIK